MTTRLVAFMGKAIKTAVAHEEEQAMKGEQGTMAEDQELLDAYRICQERGHDPSDKVLTTDPPMHQCRVVRDGLPLDGAQASRTRNTDWDR